MWLVRRRGLDTWSWGGHGGSRGAWNGCLVLSAAPVASYEVVWNGVPLSGTVVTIAGVNFGLHSFTATANVAFDAVCGTTAWSSATTVACTLSAATTLATSYSKVTVGALVGTRETKAFTFDGARMWMALWSCAVFSAAGPC